MKLRVIIFFITILGSLTSIKTFALNDFDQEIIEKYMLDKNQSPDTSFGQERDSWRLKSSEIDKLGFKFKGQSRNSIDWDDINQEEWHSFTIWKKNRERRDVNTEWRRNLGSAKYSEMMGKVIKCLGSCYNYRGVKKVRAEYLSQLMEGDEFVTEKDSYAWLFLVDGSLIRLAPNSSVTLQEVNISRKDFFVIVRLNNGFMNFIPRSRDFIKEQNRPESDLAFLPLEVKEANREYHFIQEFRALDEKMQMELTLQKNPGHQNQYRLLNNYIEKNNKYLSSRSSRYFLFTPSFSIEGSDNPVHMFYEPNGVGNFSINQQMSFQSALKKKVMVKVGTRGYKNTELQTPEWNDWYQVDVTGRVIEKKIIENNILNSSLSFFKRIPSILIAREIWLERMMSQILSFDWTEREFAEKFGYRLWNIADPLEGEKRLRFVREYIRRVETTNLESIAKLLKTTDLKGFDKSYVIAAMKKHYYTLKNFYGIERSKIFRFSNIEYYLWILKNGRE